ncbi:immunoglobulin superfamily containing leucine-rich repeat protein [Carettochelys insculpta]|uniref:immunoglobulin superfamily containing leucine-rich repeat protein n=1 Tax=Carettochelys insculpta TaxID=44489 RepID=UPI003EB7ACF1
MNNKECNQQKVTLLFPSKFLQEQNYVESFFFLIRKTFVLHDSNRTRNNVYRVDLTGLLWKPEGEAAKGGEMMGPFLYLWAAAFFGESQGCPEPCTCIEKKFGRQLAECAYRDLQAVPVGLPSNVITLTLSANRISALQQRSFLEVTQVSSLWLAHNEIHAMEPGTFASLVQLKNLDISHNQLADFPWGDLRNLSGLQLLKMNNNQLAKLPREAFRTLGDLRSLWINDNKFTIIAQGTFDAMSSLSQLQIYNNPLNCTCALLWLKSWTESTLISIPARDSISCAAPDSLRGVPLGRIPDLLCSPPSVQLSYQPNQLYDGLRLQLHCRVTGSPQPEMRWKIQTSGQETEINGQDLAAGGSKQSAGSFLLFNNGTLVIPKFSKQEEGTYTCLATNELGTHEVSVSMAMANAENPVEDLLRNNHAASKLGAIHCSRGAEANSSKAEEKLVIIYHFPAGTESSGTGALLEPWLKSCILCIVISLYW